MTMFNLLKIRTSTGIFKNEKCKVTFGLEYISSLQSAIHSKAVRMLRNSQDDFL